METTDPAGPPNDSDLVAEVARKAQCTKEIDDTYATINKNQEEYDKQLLTLSSGYLVLSLAFVKDVVPTEHAIHRWMLYSSFIVLSLCVLVVLASFQVSNQGLFRAKLYWENQRDGDKSMLFPYSFAKLMEKWNIVSGLIFVVGIVLSISFVITNLHQEAIVATDSNNVTKIQEGANMKVPASGDWAQKGQNIKAPAPQPRPAPATPAPSAPKK